MSLLSAGATLAQPAATQVASAAIPPPLMVAPPPAAPSPTEIADEVAWLRLAITREVPHLVTPTPGRMRALAPLIQQQIAGSDQPFDTPQLVVVVDRNPRSQELWIMMVRPVGPWAVIGGTKVSTGQAGRFDHYITPTGVFVNSTDNMGYRAEGTLNENGIRGLGVKGMRVWDFGWQMAAKGWGPAAETGQIRLEMHATDPAYLEQRIGRPASQGCVRIPDAMNQFLDRHGIIDANYERDAVFDIRYRALLLPGRRPSRLAGQAMIVVDSSSGPR